MSTAIQLTNSDLPFIEIIVYYNHRSIRLPQVLIDTGSSSTIFKLDILPRPISSFTVQRLKDALSNMKTIFKEEKIELYEILR